jgi:hypothetical protein
LERGCDPNAISIDTGLEIMHVLSMIHTQVHGNGEIMINLGAMPEWVRDRDTFYIEPGDWMGIDGDHIATNISPNTTVWTTILHLAVISDNVEIAQALLDEGANLTAVDSSGRTAQELATELGYTELVESLR